MIEAGRLRLQLAILFDREAERLADPYRVPRKELTAEERREVERLRAIANVHGYRAHCAGFHGGDDLAFNYLAGLKDPPKRRW